MIIQVILIADAEGVLKDQESHSRNKAGHNIDA